MTYPHDSLKNPVYVCGIAAIVKEMQLDKEGCNVDDRFSLSVRMDVSEGFGGRLKGWIVHDGTWTKVCDELKTFAQGIGDYEIIGTTTKNFSRQILKYGVYLDTQ
ncbi:MAG: hypothetical protein AAB110_01270, partial [Candidatus Desantisbacteria bacterium]